MTRASRQEKDLDRRLTTVEKNVTTGINAPGRTVSIGPNPNDISTLRNRYNIFAYTISYRYKILKPDNKNYIKLYTENS